MGAVMIAASDSGPERGVCGGVHLDGDQVGVLVRRQVHDGNQFRPALHRPKDDRNRHGGRRWVHFAWSHWQGLYASFMFMPSRIRIETLPVVSFLAIDCEVVWKLDYPKGEVIPKIVSKRFTPMIDRLHDISSYTLSTSANSTVAFSTAHNFNLLHFQPSAIST